jgi:hypothetical protein
MQRPQCRNGRCCGCLTRCVEFTAAFDANAQSGRPCNARLQGHPRLPQKILEVVESVVRLLSPAFERLAQRNNQHCA